MKKKIIYTIGHSTKPIEDFIDWIKSYEIEEVVDIRSIPKSRHNPQYSEKELKKSLKKAQIGYLHLTKLGGLRHTTKDSKNTGWINASFRGYADYMATESFKEGIEELEAIAKEQTTVIVCAEAVPWRCHRSLVADYLSVHKWHVLHIMSKTNAKEHVLTSFLHVKNGQFVYK